MRRVSGVNARDGGHDGWLADPAAARQQRAENGVVVDDVHVGQCVVGGQDVSGLRTLSASIGVTSVGYRHSSGTGQVESPTVNNRTS